MNNQLCQN